MTLRDNDRGRPTANRAASSVISDGDIDSVTRSADTTTRCRRCRHPISAPTSVRLELGPVCRDLELGVVA